MSDVQDVNRETNNPSNNGRVQDDIQLCTRSFFYTWTLSNFSECLNFSDALIVSPEFEFAGVKWRLWLSAVCKSDKLHKIRIQLVKAEKCDSYYYIKHKFHLLGAKKSSVTKEATSTFLPETLSGDRLSFKFQGKNKEAASFIVKDKLTVDCEFLVLSSSVASNSRLSVINSDNPIPERVNATDSHKVFVSKGSIKPRSSSRMPKTGTESTRPFARLLTNRNGIEFYISKLTEILIFVLLIYSLLIHAYPHKTKTNDTLMVNMAEVNALIVDSTLKIRSIAEILNLTDIKFKSSEILEGYRKFYNLSDKIFARSTEENLRFNISSDQVLNASTSSTYETAIVNNSTESVESEHLCKGRI